MSTEFLYLSERDMIAAGVLDVPRSVDTAEEVFRLLANGDYLMGGPRHNSHGVGIIFPRETPFPNMPVAGPDRRFFAMPGYLGGRFDVCGNKWYGSNAANKVKGLPRSILTMMLNNKDTGEPLSLMSANLLSSTRTGAVPGVASRYLVAGGPEVIGILGCGPINRSCFSALVSQLPTVRGVLCYDISIEAASGFAEWSARTLHIDGRVVTDLESSLPMADLVSVAASRLAPLHVEASWFKEKATVLLTGPMSAPPDFWTSSRIVYDCIGLQEAYVEEAIASGDKAAYYAGVIGGPLYTLIDEGQLPRLEDSVDLGSVILGRNPGREAEDGRIVFVACGMSVFDLGWGYDVYQVALERGIGTTLSLWDEPYAE